MPSVNINAANISSVRLAESAAPAAPASGFAQLYIDTNGDLATVKDNSGGITIATNPASSAFTLTVDGTGTAARLNASNVFTSAQVLPAGTNSAPALTTTGDTNTGIYFPAADNIGFSTGGTIRGRWTTDGLCFNADTAAANALDDYEEGTWTIGLEFGGSDLNMTKSFNTGTYTKIGRSVFVTGYLVLTNKGTATGDATLSGLPFTTNASTSAFSAIAIAELNNVTFADFPQGYFDQGSTTISLEETTNAGVNTKLTNADFANNSIIVFSGTYIV